MTMHFMLTDDNAARARYWLVDGAHAGYVTVHKREDVTVYRVFDRYIGGEPMALVTPWRTIAPTLESMVRRVKLLRADDERAPRILASDLARVPLDERRSPGWVAMGNGLLDNGATEKHVRFFRGSIETDTPASKLRDVRDEMAHNIALDVSRSRYPLACDKDGRGWRTILQEFMGSRDCGPFASWMVSLDTKPRCGYCQRYQQPQDTDGTCPACDGGPCQ